MTMYRLISGGNAETLHAVIATGLYKPWSVLIYFWMPAMVAITAGVFTLFGIWLKALI